MVSPISPKGHHTVQEMASAVKQGTLPCRKLIGQQFTYPAKAFQASKGATNPQITQATRLIAFGVLRRAFVSERAAKTNFAAKAVLKNLVIASPKHHTYTLRSASGKTLKF